MADAKKTKKRREQLIIWKRKRRKRLREEHRCIWCMKKVEPIIKYPQYCEEHRKRANHIKIKIEEK